MKKSKFFYVAAAAAAAALLTACGSRTAAPQAAPSQTAETDTPAEDAEQAGQPQAQENAADPAAPVQDENTAADVKLPDDSIGAVSFIPNEKEYSMVYGNDTLHAYFMRENVVPGSGKMTVIRHSDGAVVEEIDLRDKAKCSVGEQDSTFDILGWNGGTHLIIRLKDMPASGESYYVNLEEGAFVSSDGTIRSKAVTGDSVWCYGVAEYGVVPSVPSGSAVYVGDVLAADILVRKPAVLAKIENYDENRVRFNEKEFEQDGKLDIKIYQIGDDSFTVTFYDEDDNPIGNLTLSYTASMPPEPEEETPKKSITNL